MPSAPVEAPPEIPLPRLQRHEVSSDGHALVVHERTVPNPEFTVVLLHGRTWSGIPDFDLQVPGEKLSLMDNLAEEGVRTYTVDLRGYGETARDPSGFLSPNVAAADLANALRWVAERDGAKPSLLGWSMGSMVSHLCLQRDPDLVTGLVLYGYPPGPEIAEERPRKDPAKPKRITNTAKAARSDFITPGSISDPAIEAYVKASLAADPVKADWWRTHQYTELAAAKLTVPTLLLHGVRDPYAPVKRQEAVLAALAHATKQRVGLKDADHAAHLERPEAFVRAVVDFLRPLSTPRKGPSVPPP